MPEPFPPDPAAAEGGFLFQAAVTRPAPGLPGRRLAEPNAGEMRA